MSIKRQIVFLVVLTSCLFSARLQAQSSRWIRGSQPICTIVGTVTSATTHQPILNAWVNLGQADFDVAHRFPPLITFRQVFTDKLGHFKITGIVNTSFEISVGHNGYRLWLTHGGCPQSPGKLASRMPPIRLIPAAVISGRVTDAEGQPLSAATVLVAKVVYTDMGRRIDPIGVHVSTDDRGKYRIFGLGPGRYFVFVNYVPGRGPFNFLHSHYDPLSFLEFAYPKYIFYPGTRQISKAQEIFLAPGQKMTGIDFRLVAHRTYQVSGTLSGIPKSVPGRSSFATSVYMSVCGGGNTTPPFQRGFPQWAGREESSYYGTYCLVATTSLRTSRGPAGG